MGDRGVHPPGPPYYAVQRIVGHAAANWTAFDGSCALAGVDPGDLDLGRFLNAYIVWLADRMEPPKFAALQAQWNRPPQGRTPVANRAAEAAEASAFMAFMQAHQEVAGGGGS